MQRHLEAIFLLNLNNKLGLFFRRNNVKIIQKQISSQFLMVKVSILKRKTITSILECVHKIDGAVNHLNGLILPTMCSHFHRAQLKEASQVCLAIQPCLLSFSLDLFSFTSSFFFLSSPSFCLALSGLWCDGAHRIAQSPKKERKKKERKTLICAKTNIISIITLHTKVLHKESFCASFYFFVNNIVRLITRGPIPIIPRSKSSE